MSVSQRQHAIQLLLDKGAEKGIALLEDALRNEPEVDEKLIKRAVRNARDRYQVERASFFQYWMDSGWYR